MGNNVRFVDSLKVGAYAGDTPSVIGDTIIENNIDNYILTATGIPNTINGESQLRFSGGNLIIGEGSANDTRFEIIGSDNRDLLLIKNSTNSGVKINNKGVLQLLEFSSKPLAIEGGIIYSSNDFWVGVSS